VDLAVGLGGAITGEHGVGRLKRPGWRANSGPRRCSSTNGSSGRGILNPGAAI
jgi:glycolate oxidase